MAGEDFCTAKGRAEALPVMRCYYRESFLAEIFLAYAAEGADIIIGKIFKRDAVVLFGIIDITAYIAYILFHDISPLFFPLFVIARALARGNPTKRDCTYMIEGYKSSH